MSDASSSQGASPSEEAAARIAVLRARFEADWNTSQPPRLEQYLREAPADLQGSLLPELLRLEIQLRGLRGESPSEEEYCARFPGNEAVIAAVFAGGPVPKARPSVSADATPHDHGINTGTSGWVPRPSQTESPAEEVPAQVGHYRIGKCLGMGSFGMVFQGHDDQLDRPVAIKIALRRRSAGEHPSDPFLDEARALARLRHTGIVAVYDAGRLPDGRAFVVMEYVPDRSLASRLKEGRPSHAESARLVAAVAEAVQFAHESGLIHRDLKPANILVDERNGPRVADFGLALDEQSQLDRPGEVAGTLDYMSPEQLRGQSDRLDGRSDIWSLGVVFYEMLTGHRPFIGTRAQMREGILLKDPWLPRQRDGQIPAELERICLKCLEKDPAKRYGSAAELAADLRQWERRGERRRQRAVLAAVGVIAALVVAVAVLAAVLVLHGRARPGDSLVAAAPDLRVELASLRDELDRVRTERREGLGPRRPGSGSKSKAGAGAPSGDLHLPEAFTDLDHQIRQARAVPDEKREFSLLLKATNELISAGQFEAAEAAARRMVEVSGNDPSRHPIALGQLGLAQYRGGNAEDAIRNLEDSIRTYRKLYEGLQGLPPSTQTQDYLSQMARMLGITLTRIGNANKSIENFQAAQAAYEEGLQVLRRHDRKRELLSLLLSYGGMESQRGNYGPATSLLRQASELAKAAGDRVGQADVLVNLGNAESRSGNREAALADYEAAYALLPADAPYESRASLLYNWVMTLAESGQWDEARKRLEELRAVVRPDDESYRRVFKLFDRPPAPGNRDLTQAK